MPPELAYGYCDGLVGADDERGRPMRRGAVEPVEEQLGVLWIEGQAVAEASNQQVRQAS